MSDLGSEHPSRQRLLAAAEDLIAEGGVAAISTRKISERAGTAMSQITYHFGGLDGLLHAAMEDNAGAVTARRVAGLSALDAGAKPVDLIDAFFRPIWMRSVWSNQTYAALVVQAIYRHADPGTQGRVDAILEKGRSAFLARMSEFVPSLGRETLGRRVVMLMASALSVIPRSDSWLLFRGAGKVEQDMLRAEFIHFACAALAAPPEASHGDRKAQ
jgi:AcrR family transcriptional regulator